MTDWLETTIERISKLDRYSRPNKVQNSFKLDSNENMVVDKKFISRLLVQAARSVDLREYPSEHFDLFYNQLSKYLQVNKRYLAVGNGSDQIIELLLSTIARGKHATVFSPTFSYFVNRCHLHNIKVDQVPLKRQDNSLDKVQFLNRAKESELVYICSPNNPTGNQFDKETMLDVIESLKDKMILIDEAYVEFADYSLTSLATRVNNVVVLRTMSKAFGFAGARVGYMVSNERFADVFRTTIQSPYPLSSLSLAAATLLLSYKQQVRATISKIKRERQRILVELTKIEGIKAFVSHANFIFIESGKLYPDICRSVQNQGINIKLFGDIGDRHGCMRVTVGTEYMNDKLLKSINESGIVKNV